MEEPLAPVSEVQMPQPEVLQMQPDFPFPPMQLDAMQLPTLVRPEGAQAYNPENSALGYWTEEGKSMLPRLFKRAGRERAHASDAHCLL